MTDKDNDRESDKDDDKDEACSDGCHAERRGPMPKPWKNPRVLSATAAGVLLAVGYVGAKLGLSVGVSTALYVGAVAVGGYYFAREALEELVKEREVGIELLMTVAALASGLLGEWAEAATLVFLYAISEASEGYTAERTRYAIRALMDLAPKTALLRRGDTEERVPVEQLRPGDVFVVRPGEAVPTDGEVLEGRSAVNQAPVTGESVPVDKAPADTVFAASINGEGVLVVRATRAFAENTIARIIQLVEAAQARKGTSQRFIERFGRRYSPAVLAVAVALAVVPTLLGLGAATWLHRAVVFLVAAAPPSSLYTDRPARERPRSACGTAKGTSRANRCRVRDPIGLLIPSSIEVASSVVLPPTRVQSSSQRQHLDGIAARTRITSSVRPSVFIR